MSDKKDPALSTVQSNILNDNDQDNFNIIQSQDIPTSFLDDIRMSREASTSSLSGDTMSVARIPVIVHEKWLREGFDLMKEPAHAIVARLKQENLDGFLTSNKKV